VFAAVFFLRRTRRSEIRAALLCLSLIGLLWMPIACGGNANPGSTANDVPRGTYTLTLDGADTSNSSIAASTTLTLTVD
jgi:hypothetical protein